LELQSNFSRKFRFDIEIEETLDKEAILIPPMFLQPFIENAIAHGLQGTEGDKITITVSQEHNSNVLRFLIEDNGIGYDTTTRNKERTFGHQSLSGTILKERLELYATSFKTKARYTITNLNADGGTRVILWLPYFVDK
jgi:sensor histidine kinase YesM